MLLTLVLMVFATASWACPPVPSGAAMKELKQSGSEDLSNYAFARLLKCGWQEAKPSFSLALDASRAEDDEAGASLIFLLMMNPRSLVAEFSQEGFEEQPLLAPLAIGPDEAELAVQRFEDAVPAIAALMREKLTMEKDTDSALEFALASAELRLGRLDDARQRLDRLQRSVSDADKDTDEGDDMQGELAQMRTAMDETATETDSASDPAWIVDHTTSRAQRLLHCGGVGLPVMDRASIKSQAQLARKETDAAIGTLLQARWRDLVTGRSDATPDIMHLLKLRYSKPAMQQAWTDAEASIRIEPNFAGLNLFGQFLPLPSAVREDDKTSPSPGAYTERLLTQDEALALMRGTDLHKVIFDK